MAEEIINQKKHDKEEIEERNHQIRAESVDRPELAKLTGETIRLSSKVKYQEKIIENLDKTHSQNLIGLHAEIDRLSNLVSELMFALATKGIALIIYILSIALIIYILSIALIIYLLIYIQRHLFIKIHFYHPC